MYRTILIWSLLVAIAAAVSGSIALTPTARADQSSNAADNSAPTVIAVYFHADWCGYCKQLSEKYRDLRNKFDDKPVLYVTLDQTATSDRRQAMYMAHALGMDSAWEEHGGKTGFVLFVDADTRRVLHRVTHDQPMSEIGNALNQAIRDAS